MEELHEFIVNEEETGTRLDVFLVKRMPEFSRSYLQKLIKKGNVQLAMANPKEHTRLKAGSTVKVVIEPAVELDIQPEDIPLDIVYEDPYVLLVNKPKGMVVHPASGHTSGTLVNALLYHCQGQLSGINGVMRPGIVHRIDKDTTGLLIVCKNDIAHHSLAEQLKQHTVTRKYRAVVHGVLREDTLTINGAIGRHPQERKKMAIHVSNGKPAVTHVTVLQRFSQYTYVECQLETGRTHQIRVHLASIHHPLLGDSVYGRSKEAFSLEGQTLHAMVFGFQHPATKQYMEFTAPLPEYFERLLNKL